MVYLIKNVHVFSGENTPPQKGDVLIKNKKIVAIGNFPNYKADKIIYGNEAYLCPGFIDVNASSDKYLTLLSEPLHKDFLLQGITSAIIGNCGYSIAPNLYGRLEQFFLWSRTNKINVSWKSVKEFLDVLDKFSLLGINIGTMVGHGTIREDIVKDPKEFRNLTTNEIRVFRHMLEKSMREGAFGMSTGLGYYPYDKITYYELRAFSDILKKFGAVYTTHLKNEREGLQDSVEETLKMSREISVTSIISHFRPFIGFEKEYEKSLAIIEAKTAKSDVYFDINPFNESAITLDSLIPDEFANMNREVLTEKFSDPEIARKIISKIPEMDGEKVIILNVPEMTFLHGTTLQKFADNRQINSMKKAVMKLMKITNFKATIFYPNINQNIVKKAIKSSRALISTNSPSFDKSMPDAIKPRRSTKTFPEYLKIMSGENISMEKAIAKISGIPSGVLGILKRGLIESGYYADLVMLNKDMDISLVMVNGSMMIEGGEFLQSQKTGGMALKKIDK